MSATPPIRERARDFGLSVAEYDEAVRRENRELNELETAILGAMWSEHCSYKNSRPLFRAFPTSGPQVLQGPGENAGVVDIGEGYAVAFKVESHNHPSAVEPVQGAATGVGGILRDIFAMGARPFAVLNSLRFGDLADSRTRYLLGGVVEGISHYGNAVGVPTVGGEITFHPSFGENPLVNVMALGLMRHEDLAKGTLGAPGNRVIYVGSKTGRDGTGGAVFASAELTEDSSEDRPAVQVGDPFMEKLLLEATLEAIHSGLVAGVQDMGAAGLVSSTCEMAYRAGLGVDIHLDQVPVRETGMQPWELVLSESQERMVLVPVPGREQELYDLLAKWELDVVEIGRVAAHGRYRLHWHGELVCDVAVDLLNEAPMQTREGLEEPEITALRNRDLSDIPVPDDLGAVLLDLLSSPTIASKLPVYERYDHQVMTNTVILPGQADAAVLRVRGTSLGVAATTDCNPRYVHLDPYHGAAGAVAEAARNLACVGATPLAITDNLNFGNPERQEVYHQLQQAIAGIADATRALNTPVTGGNVSLYNQYLSDGRNVAIHPTPTIGMVGVLPDVEQRATMLAPSGAAAVYELGNGRATLGGSEYLARVHGIEAGQPPLVDLESESRLVDTVLRLIREGATSTLHDCSEGGLLVALAEIAIASNRGMTIDIDRPSDDGRADTLLVGESHGRVVLVVPVEQTDRAEQIMAMSGLAWSRIGDLAIDSRMTVRLSGSTVLELDVDAMRRAWQSPLRNALGGEA